MHPFESRAIFCESISQFSQTQILKTIDISGLVQITLQELQHSCPLLTSRIVREGGREVFTPMEVPTLPIDRDLECQDMLHTR